MPIAGQDRHRRRSAAGVRAAVLERC